MSSVPQSPVECQQAVLPPWPEVKARQRAGCHAAWNCPETRIRQSEGFERVGRITAMMYRRLLAEYPTETNAEIHVRVVAMLGPKRAGQRNLASFYRNELRRRLEVALKRATFDVQWGPP
jgi:hypothetical protein